MTSFKLYDFDKDRKKENNSLIVTTVASREIKISSMRPPDVKFSLSLLAIERNPSFSG